MSSLHDFLRDHHVPYMEGGSHRHVRYGWTGVQCPWCRTSVWHMGIRESDGYTTCWRCGRHKLIDLLSELTRLPAEKLYEVVRDVRSFSDRLAYRKTVERSDRVILPKGRGPLVKPHKAYLIKRGFDPRAIESSWNIQGIGIHARLCWRLFIPITIRNEVVSWTTRSVGDHPLRYISARPDEESVPHTDVLYGADKAHHTVFVSEGPLDCWAIGSGGTAVLGLNVSEVQIKEIGAFPVRVICFDNSKDAQRRADKLAERLCLFPGDTHVVVLESGEDPADAELAEIDELRKCYLTG